jgi:hypothetical protein
MGYDILLKSLRDYGYLYFCTSAASLVDDQLLTCIKHRSFRRSGLSRRTWSSDHLPSKMSTKRAPCLLPMLVLVLCHLLIPNNWSPRECRMMALPRWVIVAIVWLLTDMLTNTQLQAFEDNETNNANMDIDISKVAGGIPYIYMTLIVLLDHGQECKYQQEGLCRLW